jgi:nitrite reductase/ring-hydroxylating ferredoxin subunit
MSDTTRRTVLAGAAGVTAAAVLAACGSDEDSPGGTGTTPGNGGNTGGNTGGTSDALAKKSDIPVGGGKVFEREEIVVVQPTEGDFKAYTAICTHQQCILGAVANGFITCPCHQSRFAVATGEPAPGSQAQRKLDSKSIKVEGDTIRLG